MKKKLVCIFILLYMITCSFSNVFAAKTNSAVDESPELESDAAILMDAKTGEILYSKNIDKKEYPASITKVMTALLAFEYGKLDETMTFSKESVFGIERNSSHIAIDVGEQITLEQALYGMLLQSANEVALGIGEHIDGSKEAFAKHMTERAKELGCKNTNFMNPNGLHEQNHYTTAYDMALIAKEALKFDKFREIISTIYYEIPPTNKQSETRYLYGQHQMIKPPSIYVYEGCGGGKTGFTNEAQNTLVTYAKRDNTELLAVVFKCHGAGHYVDTTKLFDYGFANYKTVQAFSKSDFSMEVPVKQEYENTTLEKGTIIVSAKDDIYLTLPNSADNSTIKQTIDCPDSLNVPISKDTVIGKLNLIRDDTVLASVDLVSDTTIEATPVEVLKQQEKIMLFQKIKKTAISGVIIIILLLLLFIPFKIIQRQNKIRRSKRRKRRYKERYRQTQSNNR